MGPGSSPRGPHRCWYQSGSGVVRDSSIRSPSRACVRSVPHMSGCGRRLTQTAGRVGSPNRAQRRSAVSCGQTIPAGLPDGRPGMGLEMDGAMQHAAQPVRQSMAAGCPGCRLFFDEGALDHVIARRADMGRNLETKIIEDLAGVLEHGRTAADHGAVGCRVDLWQTQIGAELA